MPPLTRAAFWEQRYAATPDYVFGTAPNAFLARQAGQIKPGGRVLAVADGEGRNGVYLASLGLRVLALELTSAGIGKARKLAAARGAVLDWVQADVTQWDWPESAFDAVVAIFVQFVTPPELPDFFANLQRALKPGGLLLLQGYRPEQLAYKTGGPPEVEQLYTEAQLRAAFAEMEILHLQAHDSIIEEGPGHAGMSALIDLVARRRETG